MAQKSPSQNSLRIALDLAGGRIDAPSLHSRIRAPQLIRSEGDDLLFKFGTFAHGLAPPDLWAKFIDLWDGTPAAVTRFAKRFGGLALCEHGMPFGHAPGCDYPVPSPNDLVEDDGGTVSVIAEPVQRWRAWSLAFASLLRIRLDLQNSKIADGAAWDAVDFAINADSPGSFGSSKEFDETRRMTSKWTRAKQDALLIYIARLLLAYHVRRLIELARIGPQFKWNRATSEFEVELAATGTGTNMFAVIVLQLLPRLSNPSHSEAIAFCIVCNRMVPAHRSKYCDEHFHHKNRISKAKRRADRFP